MADNITKKKGIPGKDPIWQWDWPWHSLYPQGMGFREGITPSMPRPQPLTYTPYNWQPQPAVGRMHQFPQAPEPTQEVGGYKQEEINGRMWWILRDPETGAIMDFKAIEEEEPEEPLEKTLEGKLALGQYGLAKEREQRAWEAQQQERVMGERQWKSQQEQLQFQRAQARWAPIRAREQAALDWESSRQAILGQLTGPADWIRRWELTHAPNPFARQPDETTYGVDRETGFPQAMHTISPYAGEEWYRNKAGETMIVDPESLTDTDLQMIESGDWTRVRPGRKITPPTAPAPKWLPGFVPSQTAGQPITKARTQTPSAQQWGRTPWSVKEGLRGYTEYAGFRPFEDILGQMEQMRPTPSPAGAWRPARQR